MRQVADRTEVGKEFELFAQLNVDAGKAAADGRSHGSLQANASAFNRFAEFFGDVFFVFFKSFGAGGEALPFKLDASRFEDANGSLNHFRTDSVAGYESYFMRHNLLNSML